MPDPHCRICGSTRITSLTVRENLVYDICHSCDYCIKHPSLTNAHADFIASQTKYYENPSVNPFSEATTLAEERIRQKTSTFKTCVKPGSRLMEIGPGGGSFLAWARDNGYDAVGCEHSPTLAANLSKKGFSIVQGEFETLPDETLYDVICSFHIIEHVAKPEDQINKAFAFTRPGGHFILATPNAASWQQRLFPKLSPNFDSAHLHVLSPQSLRSMAEAAGWDVVACFTPEYTSGWLRVASKVLRRLRGEDETATAGKYSSTGANGDGAIAVIALLSAPLRLVQRALRGGNEVMIVLRKPPALDGAL